VQPETVHEDDGGFCRFHLVPFHRRGRAPRVPG
jgi:hypothetical protein